MNIIDAIINSSLKSREYTDSQIENNVDWEKLKNRPFYSEESVEVLAETTVEMPDGNGEGVLANPISLEIGKDYVVSYGPVDGEIIEYTVTSVGGEEVDGSHVVVLADPNYATDIATIPFLIATITGTDGIMSTQVVNIIGTSPDSVKLAIHTAETIHHLDPKYIKDMYYSEESTSYETILDETEVTIPEDGSNVALNTFALVSGETYRVTLNNTEYICEAMVDGEDAFLSFSQFIIGSGLLIPRDPTTAGVTTTLKIEHAVKEEEIHKIDNKYIDAEWMATKEETITPSEILPISTIGTNEWSQNYKLTCYTHALSADSLIEGHTYEVNFNGTKYVCTAKYGNIQEDQEMISCLCIGNGFYGNWDYDDTGEPFLVFYIDTAELKGLMLYAFRDSYSNGPSEITFGLNELIKEVGYNILPEEYLPDIAKNHDWNIVENRPFYSNGIKEDVIMSMTTISYANYLAEFGGFLASQQKVSFVPGETYIVNYNGTEYEAVCIRGEYQDGLKVNFIGNNGIFGGKDTGHPFLLVEATPMFGTGVGFIPIPAYNSGMSSSTTWNISIVKRYEDIHRLEGKYVEDMYHTEKGKDVNVLLPETTVVYDNYMADFNGYIINQNMTFDLRQKYIVNINGKEYETYAFLAMFDANDIDIPIPCLGNYSAFGGEDNGLPFTIADATNVLGGGIGFIPINYGTVTQYDTWNISIYQREDTIHKIDNKYIDAEWMATSSYTSRYSGSTKSNINVGFNIQHEYLGLEPYTKYCIKWNNGEYIYVTSFVMISQGEYMVAIGNAAMMTGTGDTGEPFIIMDSKNYGSTIVDLTGLDTVEYWLGYPKEDINKLPEKYLPETVAKSEDINKKIETHNSSIESHPDIRETLKEISESITVKDYTLLKDSDTEYTYVIKVKSGVLVAYPKVVGIKVTKLPDKLEYLDTDKFDPTGMVVVAVGHDGSEKEITDYYYPEYVSVGNRVYTIRYTDCGETFYASFNITTRSLEEALSDFVYTTNDDGTYTITDWKGTLYGQPSTECIIPNNELIRL